MLHDINYLPILRSKQAEFDALRQLAETDRGIITPLLDAVPVTMVVKKQVNIPEGLAKLARKIDKSWHVYPILVDIRGLAALGRNTTGNMLMMLHSDLCRLENPMYPDRRAPLVPVTGLAEDGEYEATVRAIVAIEQAGLCLRLTSKSIRRMALPRDIDRFLDRMECGPDQIYLVVALKFIDQADAPNIADICSRLPYLTRWKSIVVAAGSFPEDLRDLKAVGEHPLPRHEWCSWYRQITGEVRPPRYIAFGDYGIYHPHYFEPPTGAMPSASIHYTSIDHWLIMRGRQLRRGGPGHEQYMEHAVALCECEEYLNCGPDYSAGDAYIAQMANAYHAGNLQHPGTPATWLNAGFNHHLTLTGRNVAAVRETLVSGDAALAA